MYFNTLQELWTMAGHGAFVWAAYAITTITLLTLLWVPLLGKKRRYRSLRAFYRRTDSASTAVREE